MEYISNGESGASARAKINAITQIAANAQTDNYTLVLSDKDKVIDMNKSTAVNLTVPPNSSVAFTIGDIIYIRRTGAGILTIVQGSGVTVTSSSGSLVDAGLNVIMTLRKTGTDTWDLQNGSPGDYQTWTPTFTGFSVIPSGYIARYTVKGKTCFAEYRKGTAGTSNATTFTMTLPLNGKTTGVNQRHIVLLTNNGSNVIGLGIVTNGNNLLILSIVGSSFTASGGKDADFSITYEID